MGSPGLSRPTTTIGGSAVPICHRMRQPVSRAALGRGRCGRDRAGVYAGRLVLRDEQRERISGEVRPGRISEVARDDDRIRPKTGGIGTLSDPLEPRGRGHPLRHHHPIDIVVE